jgi:four helix bundle protein
MKEFEAAKRAFKFACGIVTLHESLVRKSSTARTLAKQLLRSGTSIGANLAEAHAAESRRDFTSKCSIALKEARETHYWLLLFENTGLAETESVSPLSRECSECSECSEIIAMLTSIVRTTRSTLNS